MIKRRKYCQRCKKLTYSTKFRSLKQDFVGVTFNSSWKECTNCGHRYLDKIEVLKVQKLQHFMED